MTTAAAGAAAGNGGATSSSGRRSSTPSDKLGHSSVSTARAAASRTMLSRHTDSSGGGCCCGTGGGRVPAAITAGACGDSSGINVMGRALIGGCGDGGGTRGTPASSCSALKRMPLFGRADTAGTAAALPPEPHKTGSDGSVAQTSIGNEAKGDNVPSICERLAIVLQTFCFTGRGLLEKSARS